MGDQLQFWFAGGLAAVAVRISLRARHVSLKVFPSGRIELVAPRGFDPLQAPRVLEGHRPWLERAIVRQRRDVPEDASLSQPRSIRLQAIGECWNVIYRGAKNERVSCRELPEGSLLVAADGEDWRRALQRWLARKARNHLVPWLGCVSGELELPFESVSVRGQKTRWGSCSARKTISLNYRLLFLPPHLVRHLFIHELCHTVHLNHSRRYWDLVARKSPDYKTLEAELNRGRCHVPLWLQAEA